MPHVGCSMKKTASRQKSSLSGLINCKLRFVTFEVEESKCGSKVKGSAAAEAGKGQRTGSTLQVVPF